MRPPLYFIKNISTINPAWKSIEFNASGLQ